ncbi:hypothetical protein [Ramlibacter sp.]|uniref:hypothetical protein n=1 Tax=Ramlibacter sp. TaxID=1917967 RepID=UPI003D09D8F0
MTQLWSRIFGTRPPAPTDAGPQVSSQLTNSDIEAYYHQLIEGCFRRLLVPEDSIAIEVKRYGTSPQGLTGFAGFVRVIRWDAALTPVLLQNAPVIDGRIRKAVAASVILRHTHFSGLWFQALSGTPGAPTSLSGVAAKLMQQSAAGNG